MYDFKEKIKQFADKTDDELLQHLFYYWDLEYSGQPFKLIVGGYEKSSKPDKNGNEFGFFQEVRSLQGDILYYPFRLGLVNLFTMHKPNITSNEYWQVDVKLNNKLTKEKQRNPFALALANNIFGKPKNTYLELIDKEKFIKDIFNKRGATADDAGLISRAINKLAGDMYTDLSERFVFELLQNADDMPKDNNGVDVKLNLLRNNILFIHNGLPFSKDDIKAITDIGNSTKKKNPSQTGYKGIGFKIVFQESENVLIKSGGFSFSFDKNHPYYDSLKRSIYEGLTNDEIPWQLKPIWTEKYRYDSEIQENDEFMNNNTEVAIAINTERVPQFRTDLTSLLREPRFILFLRNIKSIKVDGILKPVEITKSKSGKVISLKSNNEHLSDWLTFEDFEVKITQDVKETISSDKSVPPKLKEIDSTKINFICQIVEDKITPISPETSFLFTYLPTNVNDYKFPFLVNADFLTTANRQSIHIKNKWNLFLFEEIGRQCLKWIAEIANSSYRSSAYNLIPNTQNAINDLPWQSFYNGYTKALNETEFIYSENATLIKLKDACFDKTGFSKYVDSTTFKSLLNVNGELISKEIIDTSPIVKAIDEFKQGKIVTITDLLEFVSNESFKDWLKRPENNIIFIKFLSDNALLDLFSSKEIYLSTDLQLNKPNELYDNLGADSDNLKWLNFKKLLHKSISLGLSDTPLPLKQYNPISFINEIICKEQKTKITSALADGTISHDEFYTYLSKYADDQLFPANEIRNFPLQTKQGIILNWSKPIYFSSISLNLLLSTKSLPDGLFHIIHERWSQTSDTSLQILAEKLGVILFKESEPFSFINSILLTNKVQIINYFQSQDKISLQTNAALWSFIINSFDNLSQNQIDELKTTFRLFPILSKKGSYKALHFLYLSSAYTDNDALENLSNQFPNADVDFINADYLQHIVGDKSKIKKYFKQLDAKEETGDFLLHTLLPNLHQIEENSYVPLTHLIYENRESEQIINAVISNTHFKLKTKEGKFKPIKDCYLGSPYIDETQIPSPLDFVPVANQLAAEYTVSHLDAWQRFFAEKLKVTELRNENEILSLKLKTISDNLELWKERQKSISLLKELYTLFKSGNLFLSTSNLTYIKRIPLLCKGDESNFCTSNTIHFSSTFKPTFDFEKIFGLECGVPFLSDLYKFEDDSQLISFFEQVGITQYFDQSRHNILLQNIPTSNGQNRLASQLFKYELKKYVGPSNVTFEDLSKIVYNGKTLEDYFGFKSKLDVSTILNYISTIQPDKKELKELIVELLKVYIQNNSNDKILINAFLSSGKLLSTAKIYNSVNSLYSIDESIRSGIRENEYLIDLLFNKHDQEREHYLKLFNIKNLTIDDFNPHYDNENSDFEFTNRVNDRLLFLAFDSDSDKYIEIEKEFKEKFKEWKIKKCSRISLKYPATESKIIKEDSKTFEILNEKVFYYIGSWTDPRVNPVLVDCLSKNILGLYKQRAFIQDMLLNDPSDIITDFEKKGRNVPEEIKQRFRIVQTIQQNRTIPLPTRIENNIDELIEDVFENPFIDIPAADEGFIRSIIKGDFELNEKLDVNTTAKIKTLMKIRNEYPSTEISDEGRFLKAGKDEILVRSAQKGLLYLDVYHWSKLNETNVRLAVYTKNKIEIYSTQEELIRFTKPQNNFGIVRMPVEYSTEDYNSLGNISDKGKWHFVFIVNENTKAAKYYKEVMNLDDYNF